MPLNRPAKATEMEDTELEQNECVPKGKYTEAFAGSVTGRVQGGRDRGDRPLDGHAEDRTRIDENGRNREMEVVDAAGAEANHRTGCKSPA